MKVASEPSIHKVYVEALIENGQNQMNIIQGETIGIRKLMHDPRIIGPGWFLLQLSLDELPQLWNVVV